MRKRLAGTSYLSLLYQRDRVSAYWKHLTGVWVLFLQSHNHFSRYLQLAHLLSIRIKRNQLRTDRGTPIKHGCYVVADIGQNEKLCCGALISAFVF